MDVELIPYVEIDGARTVPDAHVRASFQQLIIDGTNKIIFFEGGTNTDAQFLELMKNPRNIPLFVVVNNQYAGFAWLNNLTDKRAFGHFAFFKTVWGKTEEIGNKILDYWFSIPGNNGPLLDVIIGMVPKRNVFANTFIQKIGFTVVGEIPQSMKNSETGESEAAVISYKLRSEHGQERSRRATI